ncbi:MAG: hypothetical protein ACYTXT_39335 [Nostoc sp.]
MGSIDVGTFAITNQTPGLVEQGNSASLWDGNSVSGVEMKADHEGKSSAVPVTSAEKWSHEAIVARVGKETANCNCDVG